MTLALTLVAAYLLGSIPFSYLVARKWGIADVRAIGSGNVGATNVMRAAGKTAGTLAFLLDSLKGAAAAYFALRFDPSGPLAPLAAAAAVLGHMYPIWLGFKGGKGVATGAGAFLPLAPLATAAALGAFAVTALVTRYVSLASLVGTVTLALVAFATGARPAVTASAAAMALVILWKHRGNIERLVKGTESRIGSR
jgi:glycerol-3-phosphate acyltransferase PlsY